MTKFEQRAVEPGEGAARQTGSVLSRQGNDFPGPISFLQTAVVANTPFLAWNGVSLTIPEGWELASLDRAGLQLAQAGKPALDLRWNRIHGRFSFKAHLKKLAKAHGRGKTGFHILAGRDGWPLSDGLKASFFAWDEAGGSGAGALFFHEASSTAILAQIDGETGKAALALDSLRCHLGDEFVPWAVYDLRALIPRGYVLEKFTLQPGRYRLALRHGRQMLVLHRLAPADVLLAGHSLKDWSSGFFAGTIRQCNLSIWGVQGNHSPGGWGLGRAAPSPAQAVTWSRPKPPGMLARAVALALNRPAYGQVRAWQPHGHNRLLCVEATGHGPLDENMLAQVATNYVTV